MNSAPTVAILSAGPSMLRGTALAAKKALAGHLYNTVEIEVDDDIAEKPKQLQPDIAFIALHNPYFADGSVQGLLKILGIKHTHSETLSCAIAANKVLSKHLFRAIGIDTPRGYTVKREDVLKGNIEMDYPYILKPINEGWSFGVHVVFSHEDYLKLKNEPFDIREEMMVEEYVPGVDLSTAVLIDEAVGTIEVRAQSGFISIQAKTTQERQERVEKVFPAQVPENVNKMTLELALKAHKFLRCRSVSRSDFRYNPQDGTLKMLEINTFPSLTGTSLFGKIVTLKELI